MSPVGTRTSRRRRRREQPAAPTVALSGLLALVLVVGFAVIAIRAPKGLPFRATKTYYATLHDTGNLRVNDQVRIGGVRVGTVVSEQASGTLARLKLSLTRDAGPLPADTTVAVPAQGLLGARYLELRPGTSATMLKQGATIAGGRDALSYGVPEVLDTFDAKTRSAFGDSLNGLGIGLLGRGAGLNDAIRPTPDAQQQFRGTVASVLARPGAAARLLPEASAGAGALNAAKGDVVAGLKPTTDALRPFVDKRSAVRDTLDAAPPSLAAATTGLGQGQRLLAATQALAVSVNKTLPAAPSGLRSTYALLRDAPTPLRQTRTVLSAAKKTVPAALDVTKALSPNLTPLKHLATTLTPVVNYVSPYGCNIRAFASNWHDFLSYATAGGGAIGPLVSIRVTVVDGAGAVHGSGAALHDNTSTDDPYPAACAYLPHTYSEADVSGLTSSP